MGLTKRYGRLRALDRLRFRLPTGSKTALVGPNGSGKTTLLRALMGLVRFEGVLRVDQKALEFGRPREAGQLAYVPQSAPRLSAPVREIVGGVACLRGGRVEDAGRVADEMGLDLAALAGQSFATLSGGQRQRLLIALALAFPARLYLLDEPTSALDPDGRRRFYGLFARVAAGATVVLSSHRLEELRHLVDRVLVLREGALDFEGTTESLAAAADLETLEVRASQPGGAAFLTARGFTPTAGAWWFKAVDRAEKLRILPELAVRLGGDIVDFQVKDGERVGSAPPSEVRHGA